MQKLLYRVFIALCMSALVACTVPVLYKDTLNRNCQVERQIGAARAQDSANSPGGVNIQRNFYAGNAYRTGQTPQWLARRVSVHANNLPLNLFMNKLLPANIVTAQYGAGADGNTLISLNYTGSIGGALDAIAAKTSYGYTIEGNMLTWSTLVTKTFDISFMPGVSQYLMGQKSGDTMLSVSASGSGNVAGQSSDSQYSSLEGSNLSVWRDLQSSIEQILSPEGKVMVSQSTTTVTVQDHPENVQKVADYLASMNRDLSKEVLLQVKVLEVALDKNFNYGINWNLVYSTTASAGLSTGDLSQSFKFTPLGANAPLGPKFLPTSNPGTIPGITAGILHGPFANTQILINALAQQGSVSTVTNPDVVTLNNQVAQIDISTQTSYLASITTTLQGQGGNSQTSLTPGVVNTGFKFYILPKIMNRNIYLQLSSALSTLDKLTTIQGPKDSSGNTTAEIQLPTVSGKRFNLRSVVPSGDTLIIAGFRQDQSTANTSTMFGSPLLGGKGADRNNVETIVLITPTIVGNNG